MLLNKGPRLLVVNRINFNTPILRVKLCFKGERVGISCSLFGGLTLFFMLPVFCGTDFIMQLNQGFYYHYYCYLLLLLTN